MIEDGVAGTIINLASMAGKAGGAGQAHYAASKAAVIALTRVTALELGCHGITANCLCPGYVLTEMGNALLPVIVALMQWGDTYLRDGDGPLRVVKAETGEPVSVRVTPSGAESLGPEGLAVRINRKA